MCPGGRAWCGPGTYVGGGAVTGPTGAGIRWWCPAGPPAAPPPDLPDRAHVADGVPAHAHDDGLSIAQHQTADRARAAADLTLGALKGLALATQVQENGEAVWQVEFEQHPDGRRRARMRVYELAVTDDGTVVVNPSAISVGADGALVRHHLRFGRAPETTISASAGTAADALHVVQYPDDRP